MPQDAFARFEKNGDLPTISGGGTGTFVSTSSYDTGVAGVPAAAGPGGTIGGPLIHDIGRGIRVKLDVQITTTYLATGGASTMEVDFICTDAADLTGNVTVLLKSDAIAKATLVSGYRYRFGSTPGVVPRRYVGVQYVIATNACTTGKIWAALVLDVDDHADNLG